MVDGAWPRGLSSKLAAVLAVAALCAVPCAVASRPVDAQRHVRVDRGAQASAAAHQLRPSSVATASEAGEACSEALSLRSPERKTVRAPLRKPERIPSVDQMGCAWIPIGSSRRTDSVYEDGRASNQE